MQIKKNFLALAVLSAILVPFASCFSIYYAIPSSHRSSLLMGALKERSNHADSLSLLSPSRAISRFFDDDFFAPWAPMFPDPMPSMSTELSTMARKITVGLVENEKDYSLKADLPGVKKEDLKVEITDDRVLTISAERKESKQRTQKTEDGKEENVGSEYFSSSYHRSMMLPEDAEANPDKMNAELVDGVLTIEIPKTVKIPPVPKFVTVK